MYADLIIVGRALVSNIAERSRRAREVELEMRNLLADNEVNVISELAGNENKLEPLNQRQKFLCYLLYDVGLSSMQVAKDLAMKQKRIKNDKDGTRDRLLETFSQSCS